jgi:uncharacterized cupredoxin-like copper-binding protein
MKRSALLFVLVIIAIIATACGGSSTPAATQAPAQPAATEAPAQPAASEAAPAPAGTQVDVTLSDNKIASSLTEFKVGVPYTFVITNTGRHGHNFNISTPASQAGSLQNALATALLAVDEDKLGSGASVTVEYTFPDTAAGAQLDFSCLIRRHYEDGMLLPITVTK